MSDSSLLPILKLPLTPMFGAILVLTGAYSLYFNVRDARRLNHQKAERIARIGGWLYIIGGILLIIK